MMLGGYAFGLDTAAFQELNRNSTWRWPSQDVFESRPVLQFTGQGKETIKLPGIIFPEYWGGIDQLDQLRALADEGETQTLVDGRGNIVGEYVITEIDERQSTFAQAGIARRQEFTITLERAPDADGVSPPGVPDLSSIVPVTMPAAPPGAGTVSGLADAVGAASSQSDAIVSKLGALDATLGPVTTALAAAKTMQAAAGAAVATVKGLSGTAGLVAATGAVSPLLATTLDTMQIATASADSLSAMGAAMSAVATVNQLAVTAVRINSQVNSILGGFQ